MTTIELYQPWVTFKPRGRTASGMVRDDFAELQRDDHEEPGPFLSFPQP